MLKGLFVGTPEILKMQALTGRAACLLLVLTCSVGAANAANLSAHPVVLVVSFDGFRYDYLNKAPSTPWLSALRSSGVSVPYMQPAFPTKTFPNHHSISTGLFTETHGVVDNSFFDPQFNDTLDTNDPEYWNYHPDVMPIWIRNELAGEGRVSGCVMWPGSEHAYGANNDLRPTYYFPEYDRYLPWESRVDTVISWITNDTKPANLVFLYYDEPDSRSHAFGPNSEDTLREVEMADNRTAYLINKLIEVGVYEDVNLILLSDHGMKEVTQQRLIFLESLLDEGELLEAKYGSTPLLQLVPREGKATELYNSLIELSNTHNFTVWTKEELSREPFHYASSRRITDYVLLADPGYGFDDFNASIAYYNDKWGFIANDTREYGVHGYSNEEATMRAFFIGHGPVFRKGFEYPPIKNVDIVPLISAIVGIPEPPTNGSLSRVQEMIDPSFRSAQLAADHPRNS